MYPSKTYVKTIFERRRFFVDYSCFLAEEEKLTTFQVLVVPDTPEAPLIAANSFPDPAHKKLIMYVSGGVQNTNYLVTLLVSTDGGQTKQDDIGFRVVR